MTRFVPLAVTCCLLEFLEFDLTSQELTGHFVEFSGDQHGSRYIQQKLESCSAAEKQLIFKEIFPNALTLVADVFGNYVIQKFFEFGTTDQRRLLGETLQDHVLSVRSTYRFS